MRDRAKNKFNELQEVKQIFLSLSFGQILYNCMHYMLLHRAQWWSGTEVSVTIFGHAILPHVRW